jgi:uncharacterized protein (TIGR02145 family)
MKTRITILAVLMLVLGTGIAQTHTYCPGDSVYLGLATYRGNLQWQQSTDSLNWTNISGATFSPYGFKFASNKYYRAMITEGNCNPVYSPVKKTVFDISCPPQPQYPSGSVFCNGATAVVDVTNPYTGKTWMDRNLGATQVATTSTDANSYGDLYQWGRRSDGHQCRNSTTTSTLSSTDQPGNANFILATNTPYDWRSPQNTNLWQGVNGVNNPCPSGYRLPTETELNNERLSWVQAPISSTNTSAGAFASPLKLPLAGARGTSSGTLIGVGTNGYYWSSTVSTTNSRNLYFNSSNAGMNTYSRAGGFSVRCLKD